MTHREAIRKAFISLRRKGIRARMNFACCSSCGHADLSQNPGPYVFWNIQSDETSFGEKPRDRDGNLHDELYLQWDGELWDARTIVDTLRKYGLTVSWEGTFTKCIKVGKDKLK